MKMRTGSCCALLLGAALNLPFALAAPAVHAQEASTPPSSGDPAQSEEPTEPGPQINYPPPRKSAAENALGDAKAYFTAPLHWDTRDWEFFGGALAAIAVSHHYDTQVRTHYDQGYKSPLGPKESGELTDALPSAALFLGTWGYAHLISNQAGETEAGNMFESAALSVVSVYALKYIIRRPRPDSTTDANHWFGGGTSFPSEHTTLAFAIGTVLAESGNPQYRWLLRTIGYGVGFGTAYLRLKHNAHWLSDTVAGGALGIATAHFVMNRSAEREEQQGTEMSLVPVQGGVMLAFSTNLPD